jgi:hypothetical protein
MKTLVGFLNEHLENTTIVEADATIKSEEDFRAAAKVKFEEVFGDELDEDKMNKTIEGLLEDNKELVEKGEWGELIGILNKSFASKSTSNE